MTDTQAFVESHPAARPRRREVPRVWNEPMPTGAGGSSPSSGPRTEAYPPAAAGDPRDRGPTRVALTAILEARGYEEIEARAASVYEHWVGSEGLSFRGRDDAERLGDVVKFHWEAIAKDGEVVGVGLDFLVLAADGRIERDYTFVVA